MLKINKISSSTTVDFAAEELKKYLRMMMPECGDIRIAYDPEAQDGFRLGLMQDLGLDVSDAEDTELDDILYIDCDTEGGIIAGDNPRSVLLAVYEYLRQNGCRWLYPGIDGEYIPMQDIVPVKYRHKPSQRYRGNCIEGAVSQDILNDFIDFLPKVGLNTFMLQFRIPGAFYYRYYGHNHTSELFPPEDVTDTQVLQWTRLTECEMQRRGIMLHSYGHGFTADPFGAPESSGWDKFDISVLPEENREFVAMLNGKRDFYGGIPVNTNFCMSNRRARRKVAKYVADYCGNHSNIDYLHIWLADLSNNHCECEECQKKTPSDWYMVLMNETDALLTEKGLGTHIVFIAYVDTSWAPISERINNPDRFTLMIAPITRDYKKTLNGDENPKTTPYVRNKLVMPRDLAEYLAYFDEWKKVWSGASLSFEYHFWVNQHHDLSGIKIAKRIYEDNKLYKARGINGVIECGSQRNVFPNGFAQYVHARSLFDIELTFDEILKDYFSHAYGDDWELFRDYLASLERELPVELLSKIRRRENIYNPELSKRLEGFSEITEKGRELIREHYNSPVRVQTVSVRILEHYTRYAELVVALYAAKASGDSKSAEARFEEFVKEYAVLEPLIGSYTDMSQTVAVISQTLRCETGGDMAFVVQ